MPTDLPERPWQKLGADLFTLKDKSYLLLIDYFSRFVEIAQLSPTRSVNVIVHLKSMFACHWIPETLITDNGPQFSCQEMEQFAKEYCFEHVTSSPRYPQSNGEAERAVRTVKELLKKASHPYRALLAYRTTALANGYSPAQLLMGRRLRTTLPMLPEAMQPCVPDLQQVRHVERRMRQTKCFNARHRTRDLDKLLPGHSVWITDAKSQGTVTSVHQTPWSYVISGPHGAIRRNRSHLMPIPMSEIQTELELTQSNEKSIPKEAVSGPKAQHGVVRTRSGREVKKPERLKL
uniref:Integrase catalytic domain-containing protein n=1 Tax=Gouania willdenowi TaxID=441366 RepID=A0A8C5G7Q6_GOUWI